MINENYGTINVERNDNARWCLSAKVAKSMQQINVSLNSSKTYEYLTRFTAVTGDVVIIGNKVFQNDDKSLPMVTTGQMGMVEEVLAKPEIKRQHAAETDFVFTENADKKRIKDCIKYLDRPVDKANYAYDKSIVCVYPLTYIIRNILAAVSILAFPEYATKKDMDIARQYINGKHVLEPGMCGCYTEHPSGTTLSMGDIQIDTGGEHLNELEKTQYKFEEEPSGGVFLDSIEEAGFDTSILLAK